MIPKFRAYDGGSLSRMYQPNEVMVGNGDIWIIDEDSVAGEWIVNNDIHLMQSTGLKDKNMVEIFEGDVISRNSGMPSVVKFGKWIYEEDFGYKIKNIGFHLNSSYDDDESFQAMDYEDIRKNYEIIGNIYENPELLEVNE
ncbi:YopX family protein [Streptococcus pneumoniae]|uniref:YopX domain protein n=1 Tax=Streptococcus phage phiARI0746 TaxID=1701837 RepID=A0A141DZF5_9CAUD|nr:YopX family protein [Streptococcus pneumoniae]YP_009321524.1 YopX family protein [Streptococcus phage phiARI0746]ALA46864.1 YopX domain protein [Streptococcus phage phiARI0746]CEW12470.1 phage protein [Streptococcus pneumoniae]CEW67119.1 phage protein [Streptococcus pneumoniae]CEZ04503.1 phage protein [Streptococcus pneumoniae]CGF26875.1 phage protein [Streptococcus pneumoniae]